MNQQQTIDVLSKQSVIARNKVLRQTYILLSANVFFSALCAYIGMKLNVGNIPWFVAIVALMGLSYGIEKNKNNGLGIVLLFALTGFLGFVVANMVGTLVAANLSYVVVKALIGTGIIFFALSAYVLATGTNFTFLGGFLFVGIVIALLAGMGAIFFNMTALSLVVSGASLIIFSGYVLYHTSNIIHGVEANYITATLDLFISIFNIFTSLLNLILAFRE